MGSLSDTQATTKNLITEQRAKYAHSLLQQRESIESVLHQTAESERTTKQLQQDGKGLREEAESFGKKSAVLVKDIKALSKNLSHALEFSNTAVNEAKKQLEESPAFSVLSELRKGDADQKMLNDHAKRLKSITSGVAALLQVGGRSGADRASVEDMLAALATSFEDLTKEREESWRRRLPCTSG